MGEFSMHKFYAAHEASLPIHTAVFRADVGCALGSSANVEQVFSASGALMGDYRAHSLGPKVVEGYVIVKENWKYPELRPSMEDIKSAYVKAFGRCVVFETDEDDAQGAVPEAEDAATAESEAAPNQAVVHSTPPAMAS
mmetsp:Transcript_11825/g.24824  ORF Transcript_11825/g.24824 Transcript_11825/m.24824 type:complete len:139 (+) Transcript_11825:2178-2594(+)